MQEEFYKLWFCWKQAVTHESQRSWNSYTRIVNELNLELLNLTFNMARCFDSYLIWPFFILYFLVLFLKAKQLIEHKDMFHNYFEETAIFIYVERLKLKQGYVLL